MHGEGRGWKSEGLQDSVCVCVCVQYTCVVAGDGVRYVNKVVYCFMYSALSGTHVLSWRDLVH